MKGQFVRISEHLLLMGVKTPEEERECIYILSEMQNHKKLDEAKHLGTIFLSDDNEYVFKPVDTTCFYSLTLHIIAGAIEGLQNGAVKYDKKEGMFYKD